jgi:hypothetical protein
MKIKITKRRKSRMKSKSRRAASTPSLTFVMVHRPVAGTGGE